MLVAVASLAITAFTPLSVRTEDKLFRRGVPTTSLSYTTSDAVLVLGKVCKIKIDVPKDGLCITEGGHLALWGNVTIFVSSPRGSTSTKGVK